MMMSDILYNYANLNTAVYDFLCQYVTPSVSKENIFLGSEQNMVLPDSEDYIIYDFILHERHGDITEQFNPDTEDLELSELSEIVAKIDCYADSTNSYADSALLRAQIRANGLNLISRSSVACEFFKQYGISILYADNAINTSLTSESMQYLHRWTVQMHFSFKNSVIVPVGGFDDFSIRPNQICKQSEKDNPEKIGTVNISDIDAKFKS